MEATPKSIFNFTEITTLDTEKPSLLPHLSKILKTPSSAKHKPLNISHPKTASSWATLTQQTTRSTSHIMAWDLEGNLHREVSSLQKLISLKQNHFNKIHNESQRKEELLNKLKLELTSLQKEPIDQTKATLDKRVLEHNEIQKALMNENYYLETLQFMLNCRKKNLLFAEPPVLRMKTNVMNKKREIAELENSIERLFKDTCDLTKLIDSLEKDIEAIEIKRSEANDKNLSLLNQKKLIETILEKEFNLNAKVKYKEQLELLIKKLEPIMKKAENEERKQEKHASELKRQDSLERKFSQLKDIAFTSKIEDIYENYEALREHTDILQITAVQSLNKIEVLTKERARISTELNEIFLNHENERKINYKEFERIELNLKDKNKLMDENENILNNLGSVMGSICGSVTRMSWQLFGSTINIDVKPSTVVKYFNNCMRRIEEKMNIIMRRRFSDEDKEELEERFPSLMMVYNRSNSGLFDMSSDLY